MKHVKVPSVHFKKALLMMLVAFLLVLSISAALPNFGIKSASADSVVATISTGCRLYDAAVDSSTNMIYATAYGCGKLYVMNGTTDAVVTSIPVGSQPEGVAVNPLTDIVYVANNGNNTISVIDAKTNTVTDTINLGTSPNGLAVNAAENLLFVACQENFTLAVISGATNQLTHSTFLQGNNGNYDPISVTFNPNTNLIYTADEYANALTVINSTTFNVVDTVSFGFQQAAGVAVNPVTDLVYVTGLGGIVSPNSMLFSSVLHVVSGKNNTLLRTLEVGETPEGVAVDTNTNMIYLANAGGDYVSVISGSTNTLTQNLTVGQGPEDVAVNPQTNTVYAAGPGISVIAVGASTTSSTTVSSSSGPVNSTTTSTSLTSSSSTFQSSHTPVTNSTSPPTGSSFGGLSLSDTILASAVVVGVVIAGIATVLIRKPR